MRCRSFIGRCDRRRCWTILGLAPAWIDKMPSIRSSLWWTSTSATRLSLLAIGNQNTLADMTPQRVAMNAPAMRVPNLPGSLRFWSTWTSPRTVPMMPRVGAKPPMFSKSLAPAFCSARMAVTSFSRISRSSSGSVPSTASSMPLRRKGSSTVLVISSRASRPSRRARSANSTIWAMVSSGGSGLDIRACFIEAPMAVKSFISPDAIATPMVPPMTSIIAGGEMMAAGLPPSITIEPKMHTRAMPMPAMVPGSTSGLQVLVVQQAQDDGLLRLVELDPLGEGDDRRPGLPDLVHQLVEALGDDVLGPVDEGDHRVRRRLRTFDQVGVEGERRTVESGEENHWVS